MRRTIILSAVAIAATILHAPCAIAQFTPTGKEITLRGLDDLKPGAQIRVTTFGEPPERLKGRFAAVHDNAITLQVGSQRRELQIAQLLRVDESFRDRKRGALVGLLPGLIGVYAWDFFGSHPKYADQGKRYRENAIALVAVSGGGAVIGASIGWKRWRLVHTR